MDFLANANACVVAIIGIAVAVLLVLLVIAIIMMLCGIKTRTDYILDKLTEYNENIHNLTQASKRVERMCDAVNQRTRAYSNQMRAKPMSIATAVRKSNKNIAGNKKGTRNYEDKKKRVDSSSFTVRSN